MLLGKRGGKPCSSADNSMLCFTSAGQRFKAKCRMTGIGPRGEDNASYSCSTKILVCFISFHINCKLLKAIVILNRQNQGTALRPKPSEPSVTLILPCHSKKKKLLPSCKLYVARMLTERKKW